MRVTNIILRDNVLHLLYRGAEGRVMSRRVPAEYAAFVRRADVEPIMRALKRVPYLTPHVEGDWVRLRFRGGYEARKQAIGPDGPFARNGIEVYEGDVHPVSRFMADHPEVAPAPPRRAYFDIEADSRVALFEKENARILCYTACGDGETGLVTRVLEADTDDAEAALLTQLWKDLDPYDQVDAWYGDGYDFPMVWERSRRLGVLPRDTRRWLWMDHLVAFRRLNMHGAESGEEKQSYALQAIATALLGEGKDKFDASKTWQAWSNTTDCGADCGACRACLARYNAKDVRLLARIEAKTGYLAVHQGVCEACGIFGDTRSLLPTVQVDGFMLRLGQQHGRHFRTMRYTETPVGKPYEGAYVREPPTGAGILTDVHVLDFSSMYPSIIIAWNMSVETKRGEPRYGNPDEYVPGEGECVAPGNGQAFTTAEEGLLPFACRSLLEQRVQWVEKEKAAEPQSPEWIDAHRNATAVKVVVNTFYGVTGSPFSRHYDRDIAEAVTQTGVWLIKGTIARAEERGYRVIYVDTDGAYVTGASREEFAAFTAEQNERWYPRLVAQYGGSAVGGGSRVKVAYEKAFRRIVFTGKKRYVGWYAHYKGKPAARDVKPEIKGLEFKRGDTMHLARRLQAEACELLRECDDAAAFEPLIERHLHHVLSDPLELHEVVLSKQLNNALSEYDTDLTPKLDDSGARVLDERGQPVMVPLLRRDGRPYACPPFISVARDLLARRLINTVRSHGKLDVPAGTKVDYVVVDAQADPTRAVWAGDYTGEVDRFNAWEKSIWPATRRILESAFPGHAWARYDRMRGRPDRRVLPGQMSLVGVDASPQAGLRRSGARPGIEVVQAPAKAGAPPAAPPVGRRRTSAPLALTIRGEEHHPDVMATVGRLKETLQRHPGAREVHLTVRLKQGDALLKLGPRVAVTPALLAELKEFLG